VRARCRPRYSSSREEGPNESARAQSFADQLTAAGADARVVDVSPLSHADVNNFIGAGDNVMSALMIEELATCAAP